MEKWLFVINPAAGRRRHGDLPAMIRSYAGGRRFDIVEWENADSFTGVEQAIGSGGYNTVVAVGGDGTVNRVAALLLHSNLRLGILPLGSGNGLARTLGLSMKPETALQQLTAEKETRIDAVTMNKQPFFCTAGIGFDAHIGGLFAYSGTRGLRSYLRLILQELLKYKPEIYTLLFGEQEIRQRAFLVTVANSGQYGNNFYIAPQASMQDGLLHVVVLHPFQLAKAPGILSRILLRQAHRSPSVSTYITDRLVIMRDRPGPAHLDGEPVKGPEELEFVVLPSAITVLTGPGFKAR